MVLSKYNCYTLATSNLKKIADIIRELVEYTSSEENRYSGYNSHVFVLATYPFLNNTTIQVNAISRDNLKKNLGKNTSYIHESIIKNVNYTDLVETTIRSGTILAPHANTNTKEGLHEMFIIDDDKPHNVYLLFRDATNVSNEYHYPGIDLPRADFLIAINIEDIQNKLWFTKLPCKLLVNSYYFSSFSKQRKWLVLRRINVTDQYYTHPTLEEFDEIGREATAACEKEAQILAVEKAGLSDRAAFATRNTKDSMRAVHADGEESSNLEQEDTLKGKASPSHVSIARKRKGRVRSLKSYINVKPVDVYEGNFGGSKHRNKKSFKVAKRKPRKTRRHRKRS